MRKMKIKHFLKFLVTLFLLLLPLFLVHFLLYKPNWRQELFLTYGFNSFAALIFLLIFFLKEHKIRPHLGYYFLYFSLIKFILFLVAIRPLLEPTGGVKGHAFLSFFVPYAICLLLEVRFVVKELNTSN